MFSNSKLGAPSFVCNATCAAEGDNTLMLFSLFHNCTTRYILWTYVKSIAYAFYLGKKALDEGQLLRDIAWARAHLLLLKDFRRGEAARAKFSDVEMDAIEQSYAEVLVKFPVPPQF